MTPDSRTLEGSGDALEGLYAQAARTVEKTRGCAAQVALARHGRLVAFRTFGSARFDGVERAADNDALFSIFSVTKAITSAAVWLLLQDGKLGLGDRVADHIPEFGSHGKDTVTVEQLLTHTAGFPRAPFAVTDWQDPSLRLQRFASWRLDWEPGSRFVYHYGSSMWVLAELLTRCSGTDYRDLVRERIAEPLALRDLHIGLPAAKLSRVADVVPIGEAGASGARVVAPVDAPVVGGEVIADFNRRQNRRIGGPGAGGIATAAAVALFLDALLADGRGEGRGIWQPATLENAWTPRRTDLVDPMTQKPALRGLGIVVAGDDEKLWRGFPQAVSKHCFGHMGAAGQIAWADPDSGLCFAYCTNGARQDQRKQGAIGFRLSTAAAACVTA